MLKILILQEEDIDVKPCGFNAFLVHNDEFELIVNHEAVPKLIEQLVAWHEEQDEEYRELYLNGMSLLRTDLEFIKGSDGSTPLGVLKQPEEEV